MQYRSDIDGLRALAVLSVIFYHLNRSILPGGFVGVDIFFVISGFLITGIIIKNLSAGTFSMVGFYSRRIRRIFPALFTVLLVTSVLAVFVFGPDLYGKFFNDLRYATLQISNFTFTRATGYFNIGPEASPLLHTWSLGVEEQFYLIWPLLLLATYRFSLRTTRIFLLAVSFFSFLYGNHLLSSSPLAAFYMLPSRAWELSLGGLLALTPVPANRSRLQSNLFSFAGIALVLFSFFAVNSSIPFPGKWALPVVAGTLLIILGGSSKQTPLHTFLSWRPVVFVGKISYSLYLWHWPIIVFYKEAFTPDIALSSGFAILTLSFLLATTSFYLIEQPFRYGNFSGLHRIILKALPEKIQVPKVLPLLLIPIACCLLVTVTLLQAVQHDLISPTTTLSIEAQVLKKESKKEEMTVYWAGQEEPFSEKRSQQKKYIRTGKQDNGFILFNFTLPDLNKVGKVRLDPLSGPGKIIIKKVHFSGGIFNLNQAVNLDRTAFPQEGQFNLTAAPKEDGLLLDITGDDSHIILPQEDSIANLEKIIIFCIAFCSSLLLSGAVFVLRSPGSNYATVLTGGGVTIMMLLLATCLQYAGRSSWRFLDTDKAQALLTGTAMTDLKFFAKPADQDVILLGDSHVGHYAWPVGQWSEMNGLTFGVQGLPACPPVFYQAGTDDIMRLSKKYQSCAKKQNKELNKIITSGRTKYVFLAWRHEFYAAHPRQLFSNSTLHADGNTKKALDILNESITYTIQALLDAGKEVVILGQVPILRESPKSCLTRNITLFSGLSSKIINPSCDIDTELNRKKLSPGETLFQKIETGRKNVLYFHPGNYITSIFDEKNEILYYDNNHLSHNGSVYIAPFLERYLFSTSNSRVELKRRNSVVN